MFSINLNKPDRETIINYLVTPTNTTFTIGFDITNVVFEKQEDNLVINFEEEDSLIVLEEFYIVFSANYMPNFKINDETISGGNFLSSISKQATHAKNVTSSVLYDADESSYDLGTETFDSDDESNTFKKNSLQDKPVYSDEFNPPQPFKTEIHDPISIIIDKFGDTILESTAANEVFIWDVIDPNANRTDIIKELNEGDALDLSNFKNNNYTITTSYNNGGEIEIILKNESTCKTHSIIIENNGFNAKNLAKKIHEEYETHTDDIRI